MSDGLRVMMTCAGVLSLAVTGAPASAGQGWVQFADATSQRLLSDNAVGAGDVEEKDYAWGDLDRDGDIDLVCVRKQPFGTTGARRSVLFLNEGVRDGQVIDGVLVDRTALLASASDVAGDMGLLTPTNSRDVKLADINGDGWLDVITVATLSDGQPKRVSHPRVCMNLGADAAGQWLGLRYEDARMPQLAGLAPSGQPHAPRFNHVAVGDINGDTLPDLYFADSDLGPAETLDFNNRLLLNANGFYVDVTATLPPAAQSVATAVSSGIVDVNGDGAADLVQHSTVQSPVHILVIYNQPAAPGTFGGVDVIYQLAPTDFSFADLNNDGRMDMLVTDDGIDRSLINVGNGPDGFANFVMQSLGTASNGFGGESVLEDLDNDGLRDAIVTDVDFDVAGCSRRAALYRNLGDLPHITLQEPVPLVIPDPQLRGTHDAAVFDINGDGWKDVVLGRCAGTTIWMQQPPCPANIVITGGGTVDIDDLLAVISAWGRCPAPPARCPANIVNKGASANVVNIDDLLAVISAWGPCP